MDELLEQLEIRIKEQEQLIIKIKEYLAVLSKEIKSLKLNFKLLQELPPRPT